MLRVTNILNFSERALVMTATRDLTLFALSISWQRLATVGVCFVLCLACTAERADAFSIYADSYQGTTFGNGAPSNAFGAAAGTAGSWNHLSFLETNTPLLDTSGNATGVTVSNNEGGTVGNNGYASVDDISR